MSIEVDEQHHRMLDEIPDRYKKQAGYPMWDLTRAFAMSVASLSADQDAAEARADVYQLSGADLDNYVFQHRGMERKYGGFAEAELTVVTGSGTISAGDLFSTADGVQFYAIEDADVSAGDTFIVRAENSGAVGNAPVGSITYMPITIAGISAVRNEAAATGGSDTESDKDLLDRFIYEMQTPSNGANQSAYINWATSISGVGRARCIPAQPDHNYVEVCILDGNMEPAQSSVIEAVQTYIDPNENGDGSGAAPIGAVCTITTATPLTVNLAMTLSVEAGKTISGVLDVIRQNVTTYLRGIAFMGDYRSYPPISYSEISNAIHDTAGVADFENLRVNGGTSNIVLGLRETPILGTVVG